MLVTAEAVTAVSCADDLAIVVAAFLDGLKPEQYEHREAYEYTMTLPIEYYGPGSYTKWMRVGWALANIHPDLFVVWCAFSAQTPRFDYMSIRGELWDRWSKFKFGAPPGEGLTKRSIMHWSRQDAREKFDAVRSSSLEYYLDETLEKMAVCTGGIRGRGCGDFDLATVLYHMYKDSYVCVGIKSCIWYKYTNHRWSECDSGTTLRKAISEDMRRLYMRKIEALRDRATAEGSDILDEKNPYGAKIRYILDISERLGRTKDKANIMIEAKELFYDGRFLSNMDNNPYLLCFDNGVVDFKTGEFREGRPEDCISMSTGINYAPLAKADPRIVDDICDFMHKLFPHAGLYEYMWDHLASVLIGTTANQTFNMYIGIGQNGKSVLVQLMGLALGQYKGDVPLTMMTAKERVKVGGVAPEIVKLKGIRYAVMQEPSKGDTINEGIMKQMTGGDPLTGRGLYMNDPLTFTPQFTIVCCSNEFLGIKSNDHGTWRRIRVVDFESLFTENPVDGDEDKPYQFKLDKNLRDKFDSWKVVFAAMLVDRAFKTKGNVVDIDKVLASSNSYRASQDYFSEFIHDRIALDPHGFVQKNVLLSVFKEWYTANYGSRSVNPKEIAVYMDKTFGKQKNNAWFGVRIQDSRTSDEECMARATAGQSDAPMPDEITFEEI
jgi:P4 family phage/plasmid primase-like protien